MNGHHNHLVWVGNWLAACFLVLDGLAWAEENTAPPVSQQAPFTIHVVDPSGNPLEGAKLGSGREQSDYPNHIMKGWSGTLVQWNIGGLRTAPAVSDRNGTVVLPFKDMFRSSRRFQTIYAWHEPTGLVGLQMVTHDAATRESRIELQPACRVFGQMESIGLQEKRIPILDTYAYLNWKEREIVLAHRSSEALFEFLLPPGVYELRLGGHGKGLGGGGSGGVPLKEQKRSFVIEKGQRLLDLGRVNLELTELGNLVGQPAPELQGIKDWKNTPPLKLADLKGNVVMVECHQVKPHIVVISSGYEASAWSPSSQGTVSGDVCRREAPRGHSGLD